MSYPDKLKVSGTLSVGPGGDRQLVPIVPAVIVQDGEENGRPTWGVTASGWAIKLKWTGEGLSSHWRMEITRPDTVIGIWSSEGYGGAEELIGLYVQISNATGTATVVANIEPPVPTIFGSGTLLGDGTIYGDYARLFGASGGGVGIPTLSGSGGMYG